MFRSTLDDYKGSGYDRGHLISSADRLGRAVVNSETFLMTNPGFPFWPWHGHSIHRRRPECHVFSR